MNKPIAVISDNVDSGIDWIKDKLWRENVKINKISKMFREVITDKEVYLIITKQEHIYGLEFSRLFIVPTYKNLVEQIEARIR
jgi:hypothetical protein